LDIGPAAALRHAFAAPAPDLRPVLGRYVRSLIVEARRARRLRMEPAG
jgi:hypothetical protein